MDKKGVEAVALSIRSLSMDAIQKANSGHKKSLDESERGE